MNSTVWFAKVTAIHPEDNSVDILFVDNLRRYVGVQVLSPGASTRTGLVDMPSPDTPASGDVWASSLSNTQDILAVVAFYRDQPIVLGFMYPQVNQMLFSDVQRRIQRHASDVYTSLDALGNFEFYHPSGAYVRIGTSTAHEDLTGKDYDGQWKIDRNTTQQVHIHVEQAGGKATLDIAPTGAITVTTASTISVTATGDVTLTTQGKLTATVTGSATVHAASITLDAPTTTVTGSLAVQNGMTVTGGTGGTNATFGGPVQVNSTITSTGDIKAGTVSLENHTHNDPQGGTTSPPI